MKERPILFSAPMVRAILAGRKTMTRRILKPQPAWDPVGQPSIDPLPTPGEFGLFINEGRYAGWCDTPRWKCPYGAPGDRLWVRETWREVSRTGYTGQEGSIEMDADWLEYRADFPNLAERPKRSSKTGLLPVRWRPAIHMPRRASRILLEVESIRVERLQYISPADVEAEGLDRSARWTRDGLGRLARLKDWKALWSCLHGPDSWDANPWVWVITFRRLTPDLPPSP